MDLRTFFEGFWGEGSNRGIKRLDKKRRVYGTSDNSWESSSDILTDVRITLVKRERNRRKHFHATSHLNSTCNHQAGLRFKIILRLLSWKGEGQISKYHCTILALITIKTGLADWSTKKDELTRHLDGQYLEPGNLFNWRYSGFQCICTFPFTFAKIEIDVIEIVLPVSMTKGVEVEKIYKVHKMCVHFFINCPTIND